MTDLPAFRLVTQKEYDELRYWRFFHSQVGEGFMPHPSIPLPYGKRYSITLIES